MSSVFSTRPETPGDGRPPRRTRTWTDNGIQYTQQESSYNRPNSAFFTFSRSAGLDFDDRDPPRASRGRRASLLGTVVNGLADYVTSNPQKDAADRGHGRRREHHDEDLAYDDKGHGNLRSSGRTKSILSKVAATLTEPQSSRKQRSHNHHQQPRQSRHQSLRHGSASHSNARSAFIEEYTSSDESDTSDSFDGDGPGDYDAIVEALENTAEYHRREAKLGRRQLEQACRQGKRNSRQLQSLARQVEDHDNARDGALQDLKQVRADADKMLREQRRSHHPRPTQRETIMDDFDDDPIFNDSFFGDVFGQPRQRRPTDRRSATSSGINSFPSFGPDPFAAFHDMFANIEQMRSVHSNMHQQIFNMPGASFSASFGARPRASRASTTPRFQSQQPPTFTTFAPEQKKAPSTLLKAEECKRLFVTYNDRWNNVSVADPNVPFPARGLKAANLLSRNTLWAPSISSPVDAWSEETVMKANTQAFFLGAVGLTPTYSEAAGGMIELGIDKGSASPAQVYQLVTTLKKERVRWHSDRLGKRSGAGTGINEALQNDARARAVYHGVCELIETAQ